MNSKHTCRFCKRSFPCGRSLGGHIRSHLIHKNNSSSSAAPNEEPGSSKSRYQLRENPKKTYKDSNLLSSSSPWSDESETEDGSESNPRNRLRNPNGKSCFHGGNHSNSAVSEVVEPEQEEIATAMCLIMLSRDVGNWGDVSSSVKEEFLEKIALLQVDQSERIRGEKIQGKNSVSGVVSNYSNRNNQNLKSGASGHPQNGSKLKEIQSLPNGFTPNDQNTQPYQNKRNFEDLDHKKKMENLASGHVGNWPKTKAFEVSQDGYAINDHKNNDHESGFDEVEMGSEIFKNNNKRSKFECNTCNKVFHSYQALGGHRASHKKVVGLKLSPVLKLESNDISTAEGFLSPTDDQNQELGTEIGIGSSSQSPNKVVQKHECPICFRVFSSGQALGGHKRSHVLAANNSNCEINLVEKSPSPEIRDFLDLNLPPAPVEEETNSLVGLIKPYWWVERSHNREPFLSLISN